jgi:hypothetical protein
VLGSLLKYSAVGCAATIWLSVNQQTAAARASQSFEAGAQITASRFGELDSTDIGVGGRASWHPSGWIGVEGELNFYPNDIPDVQPAISRSRFEGLFGMTAGPRMSGWRPFARIRPGFVRVGSSPEPLACSLIFPPATSCALAERETLFALDLGAGFEVYTARRTFVRFDIGDQMLRFPGPARDREGNVHNDNFMRHDVRVAIGGGWRF